MFRALILVLLLASAPALAKKNGHGHGHGHGHDGQDGADGQDGSDGAAGPAGPAGPAGADGNDGRDGRGGGDSGGDHGGGEGEVAKCGFMGCSQKNTPAPPTPVPVAMLVPKGYPQIVIEQHGDIISVTLIDWPAKPEPIAPIVIPAPEVTVVVQPPTIEPAKINIAAAEEQTEEEKKKKRKVRTDVNDILKQLAEDAIERDVTPPPE